LSLLAYHGSVVEKMSLSFRASGTGSLVDFSLFYCFTINKEAPWSENKRHCEHPLYHTGP